MRILLLFLACAVLGLCLGLLLPEESPPVTQRVQQIHLRQVEREYHQTRKDWK